MHKIKHASSTLFLQKGANKNNEIRTVKRTVAISNLTHGHMFYLLPEIFTIGSRLISGDGRPCDNVFCDCFPDPAYQNTIIKEEATVQQKIKKHGQDVIHKISGAGISRVVGLTKPVDLW